MNDEVVKKQGDGKRVVMSDEIFKGMKEVLIRHQDQEYRLLITRSGKLILNK